MAGQQNKVYIKKKLRRKLPWWRLIIFLIALCCITFGTVIWIIGTTNGRTLMSPNIIAIISVAIGITITLLQWLFPFPSIDTSDAVNQDHIFQPPSALSPDEHISAHPDNPRYWIIPFQRNRFFTGREDVLTRLHSILSSQKNVALTQTFALSGLGGIGKTQTALEFAYQFRHEYEAVFWARADTHETLLVDFQKIEKALNLSHKELVSPLEQRRRSEQKLVNQVTVDSIQLVKTWFETHKKWLLILDNVDNLEIVREILPKGDGHVLLTTRITALGELAEPVELEKVSPQEGAFLLLNRARLIYGESLENVNNEDHKYAIQLSEMMDGLPLALDQAGAYIEETRCSIGDYVLLFQTQRIKLLQMRGNRDSVFNHPESVVTTFSLAFANVEKISSSAANVLRLCAFLHPDAIPEQIIVDSLPHIVKQQASQVLRPSELDALIELLLKYSLIRRNPSTKTLTIHRLLQAVLKDTMSNVEQRQWSECIVRILSNLQFPAERSFRLSSKDEKPLPAQLYLPHIQICARLIADWHMISPEALYLLNRTGAIFYNYGQFNEAKALYQQLLDISKQIVGEQHVDVARCQRILADINFNLDSKHHASNAETERLYKLSLKTYEHLLGTKSPYVGQVLTHYAVILRKMKRWQAAGKLAARARNIWSLLNSTEQNGWSNRWVGHQTASSIAGDYLNFESLRIFLALISVPTGLGLLLQNWWVFLAGFILNFATITADMNVRAEDDDASPLIGFFAGFILGLLEAIAGWQQVPRILSWLHLSLPNWLFFLISSFFAIIIFFVGIALSILLYLLSDAIAFPSTQFTLFYTFLYVSSLIILPIISGYFFHSWWLFGINLIWGLLLFLLSLVVWEKNLWVGRSILSVLFATLWSEEGYVIGSSFITNNHFLASQVSLSFVLAFFGLIIGFLCHFFSYYLLDIIGVEYISNGVGDLWLQLCISESIDGSNVAKAYTWGDFYFSIGRYSDALTEFNQSLEFFSISSTLNRRAETYYMLGRYKESLADLDQILVLIPQSAVILASRGLIYRNLNRYEEALADLDQAIVLNNKEHLYRYYRAQVFFLTDQKSAFQNDISEAIKLAQFAYTRTSELSDRCELAFNLAIYYLVSLDFKEAESRYNELITTCTLVPTLQNATRNLADALKVQPENELAKQISIKLQQRILQLANK